jgi:hypothetical protein
LRAVPTTTAIASATTFCFSRKSLKSLSIGLFPVTGSSRERQVSVFG